MELPATVPLPEAAALARGIEQAVMQDVHPDGGARPAFVVDASTVQAFDTSLLAVLLHARRLALGAGRAFELAGAPDKLAQLAQLYGVAGLLGLAANGAVPAIVATRAGVAPMGSAAGSSSGRAGTA